MIVQRIVAAVLLLLPTGTLACAQETKHEMPLVHPLFSDHVVLQRDKEIAVWGWATPGERVTVQYGAGRKSSAIADADGKWKAKIGPLAQSGRPAELTVVASERRKTFGDVLVGDVWICSGQSNMEWPVHASNDSESEIANADHANIRLFTVPKRIAAEPQDMVDAKWVKCTSQTIPNFSAVGYFFAREIHQRTGVPIGLVHTSWGGTIAEAWTSAGALNDHMPEFREAVKNVEVSDAAESKDALAKRVEKWWAQNAGGLERKSSAYDDASWPSMKLPQNWEDASPALEQFDGIVWFRRTFDLPINWKPMNATLDLGPIDDADTTWVNGVFVGAVNAWDQPRKYEVSSELLKPGRNVIAIRVYDGASGGGIYGKNYPMALRFSDGKKIPLTGPWSYFIGADKKDMPAFPQDMSNNPNIVTVLHNGMLSPLQPYGIRGAIWYQGESNVGRDMQYRRLLPTMINDWRQGFGQGDFPFLIVQLANFMEVQSKPVQSGWAELREAQALTAKMMKNVGLAVTTDIGEANDIHPRNKQDVGKRLALQALTMNYGQQLVDAGPTMKSMNVVGNELHVDFDNIGEGLAVKGEKLRGFAIAEVGGEFMWADAKVEGDTVVLSHDDLAEPLLIRYNWANNPVGNLFNSNGLPAAPFRTDVPPTANP